MRKKTVNDDKTETEGTTEFMKPITDKKDKNKPGMKISERESVGKSDVIISEGESLEKEFQDSNDVSEEMGEAIVLQCMKIGENTERKVGISRK